MVGLLDIAPSTRKVHNTDVPGLSIEGLVSVVARFPQVADLLAGMNAKAALDPKVLLGLAPQAVRAVIAAGVGFPGDEKQEAAAGRLPIEMQADFLEAIIEATLPSGLGPFLARLQALGDAADRFNGTQAPAPAVASSPKSQRLSPGSYRKVNTRPIVSGATPRAKSKAGSSN